MFLKWCQLLYGLLLLELVLANPELDEDCELRAADTMHDFCCDLHDETPQFSACQLEWGDKFDHDTEENEQIYMFCTAECTYNSTKFLAADRKSLNLRRIRFHLEHDLADAEDEELLYQTYVKCDKHALDQLGHNGVKAVAKRLAPHGCHPYPGLVLECVANEMILNCPPKRFHKTAQCRVTRDYLRQCMQFLKHT
ncbi:general odorant-binding protein 68 [Drosophila grimshawi]|uniref:GH20112 n=1 Tax=Drosophila grimshawi TaxID=7222 RepID=B4J6X3_DROGR|nr:general odorant-binding protein 68 [Drosophila grimshawi]EDW02054.1 GH20112 [Drosophila grimshawi]